MLFSRRSSRPRGLAALLPGRALLAALLLALLAPLAQAEDGKRLRIGITLHPYYSYVSNIVGDKAEVVPLIPAGFNPHAYEPRAEDIKRIGTLDVVVLNGVGHDDFAERMIASSEKPGIPVIEANAKVPLLAATGMAARGAGKVVNTHTFPVHQRLDHPGQHHRPRTGQARPGQRQGLHPQRPGLRQAPAGPARRRPGAAEQGPGRRLPRRHHPRRLRLPAARIRPGSHRRGRAGPRHRAESEPVEEDHRPAQGAGREGDLPEIDFPPPTSRPSSASPG